ncbi:signal recognition particle-docking protein FtsY [Lyticum sinuosum]|uniref:Signal recognition particle receptor FtsY n=1 Tax=Lyticum sinuosum TaxID=1332059 RepID=A0AAE5AHH5_9RICK|nr:signal recognition particle-docking protein FtsY [Lyticum sinuosum]MDZ5761580.1 Signal recognition particle receptor FtsY [Lyticum sinuosum]
MSWLNKIRDGLKKTSEGIGNFFKRKTKLDIQSLDELEEIMIQSDISPKIVADIIDQISKKGFLDSSVYDAQKFIANYIAKILIPVTKPLPIVPQNDTKVIMLCGVNGGGKTTTASKIANKIINQNNKVVLAACDTFRAAAVDQLKELGDNLGVLVFKGQENQDPASVAYQAFISAKKEKIDFLIIDTAGRIHNNDNLMKELEKFVKVVKKIDNNAPHEIILVLDGTNGQNAIIQAEQFNKFTNLTGFIITKLDGSSKGGFVVTIAEKFNKPIYAIGVGEKLDDLDTFLPEDFANSLVGVE